ncbi:MAG TPA: DUF2309 domain-containing protein [Roseiflexaceae bacterium]|nr:DUF2309 domain-containing protein [Roseiflexaceae bacterium]
MRERTANSIATRRPGIDLIDHEQAALLLRERIARICRRIPPLWDLPNFVAVNPFLGFSDQPLPVVARLVADGLGGQALPSVAFYRQRWREGAFDRAALERAAHRAGYNPVELERVLDGTAPAPVRPDSPLLTFAEQHDREHGTAWAATVARHAAAWCAVYVQGGGAGWPHAAAPIGLYASWREAARSDRSLELEGLAGWRAWAAALPETAEQATAAMLDQLGLPPAAHESYLYRLLGDVYGWASLLRRSAWQSGDQEPGLVADLLAIRICTDTAVAQLAPRPRSAATRLEVPAAVEDEQVRAVFQEALEDGYAAQLLGSLAAPPDAPAPGRPAVQAVFCIDVRSEPLRRHLEAQAAGVETLGFAGFFGVALDWQTDAGGSARCPVLLRPGVRVAARAPGGTDTDALKRLQTAPAAAFTFVETLGLAYGLGLAGDALALRGSRQADEGTVPFCLEPEAGCGIAPAERVELAAGMLKNMGLRERFGRLVLLCGHEGRSANNPHAAGLDCGACGGHGGALNARVAAAVLNDPTVRRLLPGRGWRIPEDTWFLPAVHDTADDRVRLLDTSMAPAGHTADIAQLTRWLEEAGMAARAERAPALGLAGRAPGLLGRLLHRRTRDWSEVRPEWALARNAAFIAARRCRTRGVDLEGRTFLHEYDWTTDPDNSILTLILTAPMVVASWINLQYFASTVDNRVFGSGTKALHNRVGTHGVLLGNSGDLRTGLALQSVHAPDGSWHHEPLRLQVVVEAPRGRIERVLAEQPGVRELVEHGWVRLFALDPADRRAERWVPGTGWAEDSW